MVFRVFIILIALVILNGCSSHSKQASVVELTQPPSRKLTTHTVSNGETLYSIAWRYGLDYKVLAKANNIGAKFNIYPGQVLTLETAKVNQSNKVKPPTSSSSKTKVVKNKKDSSVKNVTATRSRQLTKNQISKNGSLPTTTKIKWAWPTLGKVTKRFVPGDPQAEGIDIVIKKGDSVVTAASGIVVYAGEGLRRYGKLLIIKHNKQYLSAYAHVDRILVKEGSSVQEGQKVAEIGSNGTGNTKLYFEVRNNGKPVDPLRYLPRR